MAGSLQFSNYLTSYFCQSPFLYAIAILIMPYLVESSYTMFSGIYLHTK